MNYKKECMEQNKDGTLKPCIVMKENTELHKLIKDYENDSVEALCKVNDLKAQIKRMKCCGNCKHREDCVYEHAWDLCDKWELAE